MVIIIKNGHGNLTSNPGLSCLYFTKTLRKDMYPTIHPSTSKQ